MKFQGLYDPKELWRPYSRVYTGHAVKVELQIAEHVRRPNGVAGAHGRVAVVVAQGRVVLKDYEHLLDRVVEIQEALDVADSLGGEEFHALDLFHDLKPFRLLGVGRLVFGLGQVGVLDVQVGVDRPWDGVRCELTVGRDRPGKDRRRVPDDPERDRVPVHDEPLLERRERQGDRIRTVGRPSELQVLADQVGQAGLLPLGDLQVVLHLDVLAIEPFDQFCT